MRQNPARRTALLDAAIEVLAREGSRGLTLRAVDKEAAVPTGTASNYFTNRTDLLAQVMRRTRERLTPDPAEVAGTLNAEPSHEVVRTLMLQLVDRMRRDRSSHLAMLELRLEATRRPELHAELARFFTAELDANIDFHLGHGLPGDRTGVVVLYLAMLGLIVDDLTVPEVLRPHQLDALVDTMVTRLLPAEARSDGRNAEKFTNRP
ncbi:TetR/AcrR family transcriptional regulator [Streptomyces sp. NBC_00557]|uniref:TetR/AcrR family transcriptional regulator n=1 Tax=Streptomyces sp. NBC_00557 TaxID=2975776 RepID=UPI002E809BF5|nr:TetR family transcriptional regulator [Streptomyces sp. NBC_00557]WUC39124.1 TetR family transcriptional regulator [Streptomyces sp. NBC_00557]